MKGKIGEPTKPLKAHTRYIINRLIENPRITINALKKGILGASGLSPDDFRGNGRFAHLITFRVDLTPLNKVQVNGERFSGTRFIDVELHNATNENCAQFEEQIRHISGVIEWDRLDGKSSDYLVRVVHFPESLIMQTNIRSLDVVKDAKAGHLPIRRSGIVDNFTADDFLSIREISTKD